MLAWIVIASFVSAAVVTLAFYLQLNKPIKSCLRGGNKPEIVPEVKSKLKFKEELVPDNLDVLVIGSGMGGLTAASLLAQRGKKVLVIEQHDIAGGSTHIYTDHGFEFDTGLHYIGGKVDKDSMTRRLFDVITDGKVHWASMDSAYDIAMILKPGEKLPTETFPFRAGLSNLKADLIKRFPQEEKAINDYISLVKKFNNEFGGLTLEKLLPKPLLSLLSPWTSTYSKLATKSTYEVLSTIIKNEELINVLTYLWGDNGLPPRESSFAIHAIIANHYFPGAGYPIGGSGQLAEHIIPTIERAGGKVLVCAKASQILLSEDSKTAIGVRINYGNALKKEKVVDVYAKQIISAIGSLNTFNKLLSHDEATKNRMESINQRFTLTNGDHNRFGSVRPSLGHIYVFAGFNATSEELKFPSSNYWIFPNWEHDKNHQEFLKTDAYDERIPFPAIFLSFPSSKDPNWKVKYPGKATALIVTEGRYEWFEPYESGRVRHRGADYEALKKKLGENLLQVLYSLFPEAKDKVAHIDVATPLSNNYYIGSYRGESYGLEFTPERFKPEIQKELGPETHINNLYLSGQDVMTNGVAGAVLCGYVTAVKMYPSIFWQHLNVFAKGL